MQSKHIFSHILITVICLDVLSFLYLIFFILIILSVGFH